MIEFHTATRPMRFANEPPSRTWPGFSMTLPNGSLTSPCGGLALVPVIPLPGLHEGARVLGRAHVVALLGEVGAGRARVVPVEVVVDGAELLALDVARDHRAERPGPVAFLEVEVDAGHAACAHRRHRRRPHGLQHHLAGGHQIDGIVEGAPEGAEVPVLLELDQPVEGVVDLVDRHVALVAVLDLPVGLERHGDIHDADAGEVLQRRPSVELGVDELGPGLDRAADFFRLRAEGIGVEGAGHDGHPLRGFRLHEVSTVDGRGPAVARRIHAVPVPGVGMDRAALLVDAEQLVEMLELGDVDRLHVAGREDLRELLEIGLEEVGRSRLREGALADGVEVDRRHVELEAERLFGHRLVGAGDRHGRADHTDLDVLDVLRPDGRETADARACRHAGDRCRALEHGPPGNSCLLEICHEPAPPRYDVRAAPLAMRWGRSRRAGRPSAPPVASEQHLSTPYGSREVCGPAARGASTVHLTRYIPVRFQRSPTGGDEEVGVLAERATAPQDRPNINRRP